MVFLVNLFVGCLLFGIYDKKYHASSPQAFYFLFIPFVFLWILIVGGQYNVGTDYSSYLDRFNDDDSLDLYERKGEYLFFYIVFFLKKTGLSGQDFFFIFAFISVFLYLRISREITTNYHAIFFFLFITVSTHFHNQFNGLRQCTAVYFVTLGLIYLAKERKKLFFINILIAAGFHISSWIILPVYFLRNFNLRTPFIARFVIIGTSFIALLSIDSLIREIINVLPFYSHYADRDYLQSVPLVNKLTKFVFLPFYLLSCQLISNNNLSRIEGRLFQIGILAYLFRTIGLLSTVTNRIGYFFFIVSFFPLFYYCVFLYKTSSLKFLLFCGYILFFYLVKILLLPSGEYLYSSIFALYF